ncbi:MULTISPECIES: Tat pathway signal sequence domain protein [Streptomyces]|uniref:Tat pathway signal sequence domain protein n=1 Tax=Streptomyces TaxID=1883 RepID=UPI00211A9CCF|nr:Tat pathway signal sequence domain protein [Streptomyces hilarionis]MCQ9129454.1 Tat pathway signal sequence domain protein [Streptomyces hilarionis]
MPRTGLAALAVASTALLAGAAPALADAGTPSPVPSTRPSSPATGGDTGPTRAAEPTKAPDATRAPSDAPGQVGVVPRGAADTGVAEPASDGHGTLIGGGAAAAFAAAGTVFYVVRRRRATGA